MHKNLFLILLFFSFIHAFSQDPRIASTERTGRLLTNYLDSMRKAVETDKVKDRFFSPSAYDQFFDKYFTLLNYERSNFTEGNSAGLNITDNGTRLNLTLSHKSNRSIFSVGAKLNISDQSGVLFSGTKPTAGTEIFVNHSILILNDRVLYFDKDAAKNNYSERLNVLDSVAMLYQQKNINHINLLLLKKDTLERRQKDLEVRLAKASPERAYFIRDTLSDVYDKISKNNEGLKYFDSQLDSNFYKDVMKATTKESVNRELQSKGVTNFCLQWISYGLTYRRDNYNTWDGDKELANRISEQVFNKWVATAAYNIVWQKTTDYMQAMPKRKVNSVYLGGVYTLLRDNNFSDMKEQEYITRKQTTVADTLYELTSTKKLRDITGKPFKAFYDHQFAIQSTILFGKKGFLGLNLRQDLVVGDHRPLYNSRIGTLFRFIDSKDEKAKVNFELFLSMEDLADHKDSGKTPWQRKEIGISATVPFSKVFFQ